MKLIFSYILTFLFLCNGFSSFPGDSLPSILPSNRSDITTSRLRLEASVKFGMHGLPTDSAEWKVYSEKIRELIIRSSGIIIDHDLPLDLKVTNTIKMDGYTVHMIFFQTRPGMYCTANLFVPDGKGPFPAVINVHAHSGRFDDNDQAVGHCLATDGYVCLSIDPWGAGERTSVHPVQEYHGSNLGASVMNLGESLLGMQVSDNIRGIDLLCSLPYVDTKNIGVAGASGGGNQTMWLAAVDTRVKAAVPVVSVGSFESYVTRSNCICELLIDGLTFTEEAGVLALANAIMPCNHDKDNNPTFYSSEMLRTFNNSLPVFKMTGREKNLAYRTFDLPHGFLKDDREAMLGWFDMHLRGNGDGSPKPEKTFRLLTEKELLVFPAGKRDPRVLTTVEYSLTKGNELRSEFLGIKSFNAAQKRDELRDILRLNEKSELKKINRYSSEKGWDRFALETTDNRLIPVLHQAPADKSAGYVVLCSTDGKKKIPLSVIADLKKKGFGIAVVDLTGTGESSSAMDRPGKKILFPNMSRGELWLGKTILGEWVKELIVVTDFLYSGYNAATISFDGTRETGLAALFMCAADPVSRTGNITLRDAPVSYLFDNKETIDFFSMGIHLPGFLKWGDVSLAAALTGKNVTFINPVTMSGVSIPAEKLKDFSSEFSGIRSKCNQPGKTIFIPSTPTL